MNPDHPASIQIYSLESVSMKNNQYFSLFRSSIIVYLYNFVKGESELCQLLINPTAYIYA